MNIGQRDEATKIIRGIGGKTFPEDYNWVCSQCGRENREFEETCSSCEHEAWMTESLQ